MQETPATRHWRTVVAEHEASGLTLRAFAESKSLKLGTLTWWRGRLRKLDREASEARQTGSGPQFTTLMVAQPEGTVVLALEAHKAHVVVDYDTDLVLLRRVLEAMA